MVQGADFIQWSYQLRWRATSAFAEQRARANVSYSGSSPSGP